MTLIKIIFTLCLLGLTATSLFADEVSKKACQQFLPVFGDQNIDIINNGFKRDYPVTEKGGKRFFEILKVVENAVSSNTQARCNSGAYPVMDLGNCYATCKAEVTKEITGTFAWNVQNRSDNINSCYSACTGAYVAQNAITKTLRKAEAEAAQCNPSVNVLDSSKSKQIEGIMNNTGSTDAATGKTK